MFDGSATARSTEAWSRTSQTMSAPAGPARRPWRRARRSFGRRSRVPIPPGGAGDDDSLHAITYSVGSKRAVRRRKRHVQSGHRSGCCPSRPGTSSRSRSSRRSPACAAGPPRWRRPRPRAAPRRGRAVAHRLQRVHHVGDLGLDHVDHRAVPEPGVRAEQDEEVREARHGEPMWARGEPSQASASETPSRPRTSRPTGMSMMWKPVPKISASTSSSRPSAGHDRARAHLAHAVGHQLHVGAPQRGVPVVGRQDALAAEGVVGRRRAISSGSRSERSRCLRATASSSFIPAAA